MSILAVPVAFVVTAALLPYIHAMLKKSGAVRENFFGLHIPVGMGMVFIPATIAGSIILTFMSGIDREIILINILGITVAGFVGIVDDILGSRDTLGFRGHLKCLLKGTLTTGGFKALLGGFAAALVSLFISGDLLAWVMNTLIIALFTNTLNLMDLRPGRAIKFFLMVWVLSYALSFDGNYSLLLLPLVGSLFGYAPFDFKGKGMMGDTGSNILGFAMGLYYSLGTALAEKVFVLLFLVLLHVIGERYSLTSIIARNRVLRFIDGLGTVNGKGGRCR